MTSFLLFCPGELQTREGDSVSGHVKRRPWIRGQESLWP